MFFSCIKICWVPGKLFEYEADRPSAQTSPEGPCNEPNMCDRYPYSNQISTENAVKTLKYPFSYNDFF